MIYKLNLPHIVSKFSWLLYTPSSIMSLFVVLFIKFDRPITHECMRVFHNQHASWMHILKYKSQCESTNYEDTIKYLWLTLKFWEFFPIEMYVCVRFVLFYKFDNLDMKHLVSIFISLTMS